MDFEKKQSGYHGTTCSKGVSGMKMYAEFSTVEEKVAQTSICSPSIIWSSGQPKNGKAKWVSI